MEIVEDYFDGISELHYWDPITNEHACFHVERESERSGIFEMSEKNILMMLQINTNTGREMIYRGEVVLNYFRQKYSIPKVKKILNLIGG